MDMEFITPPTRSFTMGTLSRLLRMHQWVKNGFVFFPAFFAVVILRPEVLLRTGLGFLCFNFAASAIYMFNDLRDMQQDRLHPVKRYRPIAAGEVPLSMVSWLSPLMAAIALGGAWLVEPRFAMVLATYTVMNILYSLRLKQVPILDVSIIAVGFLLRIHAGGILARVPVSKWIELMTFLLALFIALAKRRDDLIQVEGGNGMRASLKGYNLQFVDACMITLAAITVQSYIMYTVSPEVVERMGSDKLHATSLFVILGMMRYFQLTLVEKRTGAPSKLLLTDRPIQLIILGWILSFGAILYAF
jgi:4-hydroxybenzoate polyprenyltransferase